MLEKEVSKDKFEIIKEIKLIWSETQPIWGCQQSFTIDYKVKGCCNKNDDLWG